jgi:hypothetical protein
MSQVQSIDFVQATAIGIGPAVENGVLIGNATAVESPTCKVGLKFFCVFTPGASTTAITVRLYRGTTVTSPLVGVAVALSGMFVAGSPCVLLAVAADTLVNAGQAQYSVSIQQTAGTVAGLMNIGVLETTVISG